MVLLLIIVNHVENKEDYKKARLWAIDKIKDRIDEISEDELEYMKNILHITG